MGGRRSCIRRSLYDIKECAGFAHHRLVGRAQRTFELGQQILQLLALELMADGAVDEAAQPTWADPALHLVDQPFVHSYGELASDHSVHPTQLPL